VKSRYFIAVFNEVHLLLLKTFFVSENVLNFDIMSELDLCEPFDDSSFAIKIVVGFLQRTPKLFTLE